jgi:hypothetical protein
LTPTVTELYSLRMNATELDLERLLNEKQAGQVLGVTASGMRGWRANGGGPPWFRISKRLVRYDPRALRAWIEAQAEGNGRGASKHALTM